MQAIRHRTQAPVSFLKFSNDHKENVMKVAIIGCGLVGMEAARHLKRAGHEVTGTTTRESRVKELSTAVDRVAVLQGNDRHAMAGLLKDMDVVIVTVSGGMFAQAGKGTVRAPELYKSIYIDTVATLNDVLANNHSVKQVIYTSAETVYAGIEKGPIVETVQLPDQSNDPATASFVETERLVTQARRLNRNVCILRLAIVYGRRFSMELMIDLARKGPVPFSGDCVLTFVHVRDVGRALAHAVDRNLDGIYNVDASPCYYQDTGKVLTNREFFGSLAAREAPPFEIEWLDIVKGWGQVSNQALTSTGFQFEITRPDFKEPDCADVGEAVRRLCLPMRDRETGRFTHRGYPVEIELPGGARSAGHPLLGVPFLQELYVKSMTDEQERLMTALLGVMQKGGDESRLLMHYYALKPASSKHVSDQGCVTVSSSEIGELMYTLELKYNPDEDCYRGDQRYDVKLRHLIGMMPADIVKKIFSKEKKNGAENGVARQGVPMPEAEWHLLELHPTHTMYMHAFLAAKTDAEPMPMMGMQKPYRFEFM
jgi:nucleoside-diphosphate-sugar epimerase